MTEDIYDAIVKLLAELNGERIHITDSMKMARMYR